MNEELADITEPTHSIEGVELFKAGDYGDKGSYDESFLDQLATSYDPTHHEAPCTLDHRQDGPSFGFIKKAYRKGASLFADLINVPDRLKQAIENGRYKKRSIEFYRDLNGKGPALRAVSFLGAKVPEVKGMANIFSQEKADDINRYTSIDFEENPQMPEDIKTDTTAIQLEEAKKANDILMAELKAVKDQRIQEQENAKFEESFNKAFTEGRVLPAEKATLKAIFDSITESKVKFGEEEVSPRDLLLKSFSAREPVISFKAEVINKEGFGEKDTEDPNKFGLYERAKKLMSEKNLPLKEALLVAIGNN